MMSANENAARQHRRRFLQGRIVLTEVKPSKLMAESYERIREGVKKFF